MDVAPQTAVTIRAITRADLPALIPLLNQLDRPGTPPLDLERAEEIFARLERYPDYRVFIAEQGGQAVGTYSLLIMDNLGHRGTPIGIVECVAVDSEHRGHGIGRLLMHHAMGECREAGCYKLALSSNVVRTDAHAFYDALGFKRHGISFVVEF
jgi:GNAT superfamily N-acetyltransferase